MSRASSGRLRPWQIGRAHDCTGVLHPASLGGSSTQVSHPSARYVAFGGARVHVCGRRTVFRFRAKRSEARLSRTTLRWMTCPTACGGCARQPKSQYRWRQRRRLLPTTRLDLPHRQPVAEQAGLTARRTVNLPGTVRQCSGGCAAGEPGIGCTDAASGSAVGTSVPENGRQTKRLRPCCLPWPPDTIPSSH
jgi:hypothetical protein